MATSLFLPVEIYELTEHATKFKIATLAVNVFAVVYLLWSKRLFGIRGGGKAYEAELTSESLLHEPEPRTTLELPFAGGGVGGSVGGPGGVGGSVVSSGSGGPREHAAPLNPIPAAHVNSSADEKTIVTPDAALAPTVQVPLADPPQGIVQA